MQAGSQERSAMGLVDAGHPPVGQREPDGSVHAKARDIHDATSGACLAWKAALPSAWLLPVTLSPSVRSHHTWREEPLQGPVFQLYSRHSPSAGRAQHHWNHGLTLSQSPLTCDPPVHGRASSSCSGHCRRFSGSWATTARDRTWTEPKPRSSPFTQLIWHRLHGVHSVR